MTSLVDFNGRQIDPRAQLLDLDRTEAEDSLYVFLKQAWKYVDPAPFTEGWHIQAIAEHLQAVCDGEIKRLMIHMPPRHCKSLLLSVAFPAWVWAQATHTHTSGPGVAFLFASYADKLSLRDSVKCRRLIESPYFQERWGDRFKLASDANTKSRFSNSAGGERLITSIGAGVTGEGGNIICIDDPNAANEMESEATTTSTIDWWSNALSTRTNDPDKSAIVLLQQRLRENDLSGHIMEHEFEGWCHLCLPGRFEKWRKSFVTTIGWSDPREEEGELLWPQRFSEQSLKNLERTMGPYIFAGQIQQRPEPAGGGIIRAEWWIRWDPPESAEFPEMDFILATLDTAYTKDNFNDPSGMTVWGVYTNDQVGFARASRIVGKDGRPIESGRTENPEGPKVILLDAWTERLELHELVTRVAKCAKRWKVHTLMIENKASGISVSQELRRLYSDEHFGVRLFDPKSQDKVARLYSVQHLFADKMIWAPDREYAQAVITQVSQFPKGRHDEFVDCTSMALRYLRDNGMLVRKIEKQIADEALVVYPGGKEQALYQC